MFVDMTNILGLPLTVVPQVSQNRNGIHSKVVTENCKYKLVWYSTKENEFLSQQL